MYSGQIIMSGQTAYTPWFPRQSDNARFTFEFLGAGGSNPDTGSVTVTDTVTYKVFTKNQEDAGDGTVVGSTLSQTSTGFGNIDITGGSGLQELVRFEIASPAVTATVDAIVHDLARWVYFRILAPIWYDKA